MPNWGTIVVTVGRGADNTLADVLVDGAEAACLLLEVVSYDKLHCSPLTYQSYVSLDGERRSDGAFYTFYTTHNKGQFQNV